MSATPDDPTLDLSRLNPPETAPRSGRQFLALIQNPHTGAPTWAVIQWAPAVPNSPNFRPDWRWQVPGFAAAVEIIGWVCEVPFNDAGGDYAIEGKAAWTRHGL